MATRHQQPFHTTILFKRPTPSVQDKYRYRGPIEIGYARVSIAKQDLDRQIEALGGEGIPDRHIYVDKKSGSTTNRTRAS
jgi:predicted site-specific integrase-resolvase